MADSTATGNGFTTPSRQVWSDFLNWGGIAATAWQMTFSNLEWQLRTGLIPYEQRAAATAAAFARNYEYLADRVSEWANLADSANGPRAQAFAESIRADYLSKAAALSNNAIEAAQRLESASAGINAQLSQFAPAIASKVGTAFDWTQVADAALQGDLAGVYGNMAQMVAAEAAGALAGAVAIGVGGSSLAVAVAAGVVAAGVAYVGSDKGWGFFGDFGRWLEPFALAFGLDIRSLLPEMPEWLKELLDWLALLTSPLVLDLDGDGIEISQAGRSVDIRADRIYFDHDGDGIQSNGAWLQGDDGFLGMDRNGNGEIDNGAELFGSNTLLANGQKAADGFVALAEQDTNGDGVLSASDTGWGDLLVWRDVNQDGVSQPDELFTLDELGITLIDITRGARHDVLGDGTRLEGAGTFVMNGRTHDFTDAWFNLDSFHGRATDPVTVDDDVKDLPDMNGSGSVRSLHEAATLSSPLENLLVQFGEAATPAGRHALLEAIVLAWADTSTMVTSQTYRDSMGHALTFSFDGIDSGSAEEAQWIRRYCALEKFFGQHLNGFIGPDDPVYERIDEVSFAGAPGIGRMQALQTIWRGLTDWVYQQLQVQSLSAPLLRLVNVEVDGSTGEASIDFSAMDAEIASRLSVSDAHGLESLLAVAQACGRSLLTAGWQGLATLEQALRTVLVTPEVQAVLTDFNVTVQPDGAIVISSLSTSVTGSRADDRIVLGSDAANRLFGADGTNVLVGGMGNDGMDGANGSDWLEGGTGDDRLSAAAGADVLVGGAGNDSLWGGTGSDSYRFGANFGQDVVFDSDSTVGNTDSLILSSLLPGQVRLQRESDHLVIRVNDSADSITVREYFISDANGGNAIEYVEFADGSRWDVENIKALVLLGDATGQTLTGYSTDDTIEARGGDDVVHSGPGADKLSGGDGDDQLFGGTGNDLLSGGAGADTLQAGPGADTLDGGIGNDEIHGDDSNSASSVNPAGDGDVLLGGDGDDTLMGGTGDDDLNGGAGDDSLFGGSGSDTYRFGADSGNDTVVGSNADRIVIDADIGPADIQVEQVGGDLMLFVLDETGEPLSSLTITNYFAEIPAGSRSFATRAIEFADGTTWDVGTIGQLVSTATSGDDSIAGSSANDALSGLAGDDSLFGARGSDSLDGGFGSDMLVGDDGYDAINYLLNGTVIESVLYTMSLYTASATGHGDVLNGGSGNDVLIGELGHDTLLGGEGADRLFGGSGDDVLDAGAGMDAMAGGTGSDTFLFGRGDGQDVVDDIDTAGPAVDTIVFKAGVLPGDVTEAQDGDDLVLTISGTSDQIRISRYFTAERRIEEIRFADSDSTAWGPADVLGAISDVPSTPPVNHPPAVAQLVADQQVVEGAFWRFVVPEGTFRDEDGGSLVLTATRADGSTLPPWLTFDSLTRTFSGAPGNDDVQTLTVKLTATDAHGAEVATNFDLTVVNSNDAPLAVALTGTSASDTLIGSEGDDRLDGLAGRDRMEGKGGDDSYIVDNTGDKVVEAVAGGHDTVRSSANYKLGPHVEALLLTGTARNGDGNDLPNTITGTSAGNTLRGNGGDDTLDGGGGIDRLYGGAGNDTYHTDGGDNIRENAGSGSDLVISSVDFALPSNVENLTLVAAAVRGTGNAQANVIVGSNVNNLLEGGKGDDVVQGGAGDDTLVGEMGADTLQGGVGSDIYVLGRGCASDLLRENDGGASADMDVVQFGRSVVIDQLWFRRSGENLEVSIIGTADKVVIENWYQGTQHQVEQFRTDAGRLLAASDVQNLVDAMVSYAQPTGTTLPASYQSALIGVIESSWE